MHDFRWRRGAAGLLPRTGHTHHLRRREHGRERGGTRGGGQLHYGGDGADLVDGVPRRRFHGQHLLYEVRYVLAFDGTDRSLSRGRVTLVTDRISINLLCGFLMDLCLAFCFLENLVFLDGDMLSFLLSCWFRSSTVELAAFHVMLLSYLRF